MQGEHSKQNSFFGMIYEDLIPPDHLLRKLAAAVDLSFVSETVSDCYCPDNGRPSWDPLILFKVVFLQFLYGDWCERHSYIIPRGGLLSSGRCARIVDSSWTIIL